MNAPPGSYGEFFLARLELCLQHPSGRIAIKNGQLYAIYPEPTFGGMYAGMIATLRPLA